MVTLAPPMACSRRRGDQPRFGAPRIRPGRDWCIRESLKFRAMVDDADKHQHALRHLSKADGLFDIAGGPRIVRIGTALRLESLDEVPQVWNVLREEHDLRRCSSPVAEEEQRGPGWD